MASCERYIFKKAYNGVIKFVRGNVATIWPDKAKELLEKGIIEKYTGEYPPKTKMKNKWQ